MLRLVLCCALVSAVVCFRTFLDKIPNGDKVPNPCMNGTMWEGVGHTSAAGRGARNNFGEDFDEAEKMWTPEFCRMDSDGDGETNGQELGDPECVWTNGTTPARTTNITHPGICGTLVPEKCNTAAMWEKCESSGSSAKMSLLLLTLAMFVYLFQ